MTDDLPPLPPADIVDVVHNTHGWTECYMRAYGRLCASVERERIDGAEILSEYTRTDGKRQYFLIGAWLRPGDVAVILRREPRQERLK